MTTAVYTHAPRPSFIRRALVAVVLALGLTATALPAQEAQAATLTFSFGSHTVTAPTSDARAASLWALWQRGDPYVYGAEGPSSFDCSGLTWFAWMKAGHSIPRTSRSQSTFGRYVSKSYLRAGDLVFFYSPVSHVGIYVGDGYIVHAPHSGDVVRLARLSYMPSYAGARRPY
jgi:cell wall-associated NlpC family hydrolase